MENTSSDELSSRPAEIEQFIDQFLSTVCDASRRRILEYLSVFPENTSDLPERSVGEIASHLGLALSTTSEHLKELFLLHLLVTRKEGKKTFYRLRNHELVKVFHGMIASLEDHYHQGLLPPANPEEIL